MPRGEHAATDRRTRRLARATAVVIVVVLGIVPLVLQRDSFPLSDYPMFSSRRTTKEPVGTAVGVTARGDVVRLSPMLISGSREVILAGATVNRAIASGGADGLCSEIAQRVSAGGPEDVDAIEVVVERYDSVAWFRGGREVHQRDLHARCTVHR